MKPVSGKKLTKINVVITAQFSLGKSADWNLNEISKCVDNFLDKLREMGDAEAQLFVSGNGSEEERT